MAKNKRGLVWKKMPKDDVKLAVNLKLLYVVLHSPIVQINDKLCERETFFIGKMNQFPFESYINVNGNERK